MIVEAYNKLKCLNYDCWECPLIVDCPEAKELIERIIPYDLRKLGSQLDFLIQLRKAEDKLDFLLKIRKAEKRIEYLLQLQSVDTKLDSLLSIKNRQSKIHDLCFKLKEILYKK